MEEGDKQFLGRLLIGLQSEDILQRVENQEDEIVQLEVDVIDAEPRSTAYQHLLPRIPSGRPDGQVQYLTGVTGEVTRGHGSTDGFLVLTIGDGAHFEEPDAKHLP